MFYRYNLGNALTGEEEKNIVKVRLKPFDKVEQD